jgi:hypothetical protein
MTELEFLYRDQIVRATLGTQPAILAKPHDQAALDRLAQRLADTEVAVELLRAKGYGNRGMTLSTMVRALPDLKPLGMSKA